MHIGHPLQPVQFNCRILKLLACLPLLMSTAAASERSACNPPQTASANATAPSQTAPFDQAEQPINLLKNEGFEQMLEHWNIGEGYRLDVAYQVVWRMGAGIDGSDALEISADVSRKEKAIEEVLVWQCVPLGQADQFIFGGNFRREGKPLKPSADRLYVYWYESLNCSTGGQFGDYVEPLESPGWQTLTSHHLQPSLGARAASLRIVQDTRYANRATAYWDKLFFRPVASPPAKPTDCQGTPLQPSSKPAVIIGKNLLRNGDFQQDISSWETDRATAWVNEEGDSGPGAVRVTLALPASTEVSVGGYVLTQCVNFGAAQAFVLGASFKQDPFSTQKGGARLRVAWFENANCTGRVKIGTWVDPMDRPEWQHLKLGELNAPPNSSSALIEVIQSLSSPGSFAAYWDDFYFVPTQ